MAERPHFYNPNETLPLVIVCDENKMRQKGRIAFFIEMMSEPETPPQFKIHDCPTPGELRSDLEALAAFLAESQAKAIEGTRRDIYLIVELYQDNGIARALDLIGFANEQGITDARHALIVTTVLRQALEKVLQKGVKVILGNKNSGSSIPPDTDLTIEAMTNDPDQARATLVRGNHLIDFIHTWLGLNKEDQPREEDLPLAEIVNEVVE